MMPWLILGPKWSGSQAHGWSRAHVERRRPYVARFSAPTTVAIRNGLRFKSSDSVPNRRVQLGHSPFRTSSLLDRGERLLAWPTCQSSEGL